MKSEERHDLATNDLEKALGKVGKFFERHGSKVVLGLAVVIIACVGGYWVKQSMGQSSEDASSEIITATAAAAASRDGGSGEEYLAVADNPDYSKLKLAVWARLKGAENKLPNAIASYFSSRKGGADELGEVRKSFETVLETSDLPKEIRSRALYGLAICLETLSEGDTSAAIKAYQQLLNEFPDSDFYSPIAKRRIAELKTDRAKQLYAFLASNKRGLADIKRPKDVTHPTAPVLPKRELPVTLPEIPLSLDIELEADSEDEGSVDPFPPPVDGKTGGTDNGDGKNGDGKEKGPLKFPDVEPKKDVEPKSDGGGKPSDKKVPASEKKTAPLGSEK